MHIVVSWRERSKGIEAKTVNRTDEHAAEGGIFVAARNGLELLANAEFELFRGSLGKRESDYVVLCNPVDGDPPGHASGHDLSLA